MDIKLHSDELTQWLMKEDQTKLLLHLVPFYSDYIANSKIGKYIISKDINSFRKQSGYQ